MKKLNRKGFTLIELLAVIVVLAIVLVVTIPSVLTSMDTAKHKSLENAADTIRLYFQNQYDSAQLADTALAPVDGAYTDFGGISTTSKALNATIIKAAGVSDTTGLNGTVKLSANNKVCVELTAGNTSTKFYINSNTTGANTAKKGDCQ